jgi:hypothetical protein
MLSLSSSAIMINLATGQLYPARGGRRCPSAEIDVECLAEIDVVTVDVSTRDSSSRCKPRHGKHLLKELKDASFRTPKEVAQLCEEFLVDIYTARGKCRLHTFHGWACICSLPDYKKRPICPLGQGGVRGLGWSGLGWAAQGGLCSLGWGLVVWGGLGSLGWFGRSREVGQSTNSQHNNQWLNAGCFYSCIAPNFSTYDRFVDPDQMHINIVPARPSNYASDTRGKEGH